MRLTFSAAVFLLSCSFVTAQGYMYSDTTYRIAKNQSEAVVIQNSLPKGGRYTDPAGKTFGYVIFWNRVKNETINALELTIDFPADSFTTLFRPGTVLKIFLPPDTMTIGKEGMYDFGATGLKSFMDSGLRKPTRLQKTINPKEDYYFYTAICIHALPPGNGALRTGLVLKGQQLFYRIAMTGQPDSALVPCGQIVFKK
jgi:hypothetical protein